MGGGIIKVSLSAVLRLDLTLFCAFCLPTTPARTKPGRLFEGTNGPILDRFRNLCNPNVTHASPMFLFNLKHANRMYCMVTLQVRYAVHPNRICSCPHRSRQILPPMHRRSLWRRWHHQHSRSRRYLPHLHQLRRCHCHRYRHHCRCRQ
jgi:hypothetical protein